MLNLITTKQIIPTYTLLILHNTSPKSPSLNPNFHFLNPQNPQYVKPKTKHAKRPAKKKIMKYNPFRVSCFKIVNKNASSNNIPIMSRSNKLRDLLNKSLSFSTSLSTSPTQPQNPARMDPTTKPVLKTRLCIIGSGPAAHTAHTAAIYAARAELKPILFEGWMANDIAAGGQLTTTSDVENFPGFPEGITGLGITDKFREQSVKFGTEVISETVNKVEFGRRPFRVFSDETEVAADAVVVATGAVANKLEFAGSEEFWQKGISACAVCDGAAPIFRGKPLAVIGGGDSAMEEANFLTKYGSKVYIIHRRDTFRASKIMQKRAMENKKIEVVWNAVVESAHGDPEKGGKLLGGLMVKDLKSEEVKELKVNGLFFAIGHVPATKFLDGQLELDGDGYVVTKPGTTLTSVEGIFAAGDVQDKKYRQAVTAAGTGCMAALDAEHYLQEIGAQEGKSD